MKKSLLLVTTALLATTSLAGCDTVKLGDGFVKLENPTMLYSDVDSGASNPYGEAKILVIPIKFTEGTGIRTWTDEKISSIENMYFSDDYFSFKNYYETVSLNQFHFSGMVTDIYETTYSTDEVEDDESYRTLFAMLKAASKWAQENNPDVNWEEYDLNEDGYFDNIHFITNYNATKWSTPLWPHKYSINYKEKGYLGVGTYSVNAINYANNAITAIHEQGHIFGLPDYYDYNYSGVDYVGQLDMQSNNVFDWNSFSKFSVGWAKPYVYTGEKKVSKIKLSAASINNDCLVVPANYETYNGSAFDEYFLIELFSPYGNNAKDWPSYKSLGDYGVRLYHVDARLEGYDSEACEHITPNSKEDLERCSYVYEMYDNNYYENNLDSDRQNTIFLSLIQKMGSFSFGTTDEVDKSARHALNKNDLFLEGDEFTFDKYSIFLHKDKSKHTHTNKQEEFNYTIKFEKMSAEEVTIVITKNV